MKKLLLICTFALLTMNAFTQNLFFEKYEKLRKSTDKESFQVTRLNEKEIKELIKASDDPNMEIMKSAKTALMGFDMDEEALPDKGELDRLINQYEELLSFNNEDFSAKIIAKMKKEKINELIVIMNMANEANIIVDFEFKKPVNLNNWEDLAGGLTVNGTSLNDMIKDATTNNNTTSFSEYETSESFDDFTIIEQGDKYGVKNKDGNIIIPVEYDDISSFDWIDNRQYIYLIKGNKEGLADLDGKIIIPVEYDDISSFDEINNRQYIYLTKGDKEGIADLDGKIIIPAEYDDISGFDNIDGRQCFYLTKGDKEGLAGINGKILIPIEYDDISGFDNIDGRQYIYLTKGDKEGLADFNGKIILPVEYDNISEFDIPGYIEISKGDKIGLADKNGKIIIKPIYEELNINSKNQIEMVKENGSISIFKLKIK